MTDLAEAHSLLSSSLAASPSDDALEVNEESRTPPSEQTPAPLSERTPTPSSEQMPTPSSEQTPSGPTFKRLAIQIVHTLLVVLHIVALVVAVKGWAIHYKFTSVVLVQTGVTAVLQVASILIVAPIVSLVREVSMDSNIRRR
ncbi:hypothetical protein C8R46DRAFT_646485 [Mycena filopes]|nr:hypothetical protein C8R46DRAFT_646485 [Mycena filopes]